MRRVLPRHDLFTNHSDRCLVALTITQRGRMCVGDSAIFTFSELRSAGRSRRTIAAEVASGFLLHLRRGVYAERGTCEPVVSAAQHGGTPACVTAARHLGLWVLEGTDQIHVWMREAGHGYPHDGCSCILHWSDIPLERAFASLPIAHVLRQILRCRGVEQFFVALESALRLRLLRSSDRAWLHDNTNAHGREALRLARSDADSGLESLVRWRLRNRRLPVRTQVKVVSVGRVDLIIGDVLIVEVDGAPFHDGESQRHRDLRRDAHAAAWGYITLRFDYALVVHDWPTVEMAILAYVDRNLHLAR
ncbi:very-short-patch-repair endonuclease [Microbacterium sp. SORGH_AS 1204]|nr:very-short-patch-repair endonuclease [Microbacterium sp. SORGH_AS_1204]